MLLAFNHIDMLSFREEELRKLKQHKQKSVDKVFAPNSATQAATCNKNSVVEHVTEYSEAAEWAKRSYLTWRKSLLVCSEAHHNTVAYLKDEPR